jgi:hypothetical protein
VQSNHCRATAAAARRVGLQPHVVIYKCTIVSGEFRGFFPSWLVLRLFLPTCMHATRSLDFNLCMPFGLCLSKIYSHF